jgi:colicin import membrane protein
MIGVSAIAVIAMGGLAIYASLARTPPRPHLAQMRIASVATTASIPEAPRREPREQAAPKIDEIERALEQLPPEKPAARPQAARPKEPPPAKMSPAAWRELDQALASQIKRCWTYPKTKTIAAYAPKMKVSFARDGSLSGHPVLLNVSADPAAKKIAASATAAMSKCKALAVPQRFQAFYDEWKVRVIHFDVAA